MIVIASCRNWHKKEFANVVRIPNLEQLWVSDPLELVSVLESTEPRYIFFLHWNWIVPENIFSRYECICFHMTDVPYGRGGSPLQNLILRGHANTKLTALKMVGELDAGPVYKKVDLDLNGSAEEIYIKAGLKSFEMIEWILTNQPTPKPQEGEVVNFKRRKPEQSLLPKTNEPINLYDFIRMLDADGYPHAYIQYGDFRLEFRHAERKGEAVVAKVIIKSIMTKD